MENCRSWYLLSLDCEATGLSKYADQVTELGMAIYLVQEGTSFKELPHFCTRVCPTIEITRGAQEVTGITMHQLLDKPKIKTALLSMQKHVNSVCSEDYERHLVAYNGIGYDLPLLVAELQRTKENPTEYFRRLRLTSILDLMVWGKLFLDRTCLHRRKDGQCSYRLGDVFKAACHRPLEGAHGALADCCAVVEMMKAPLFQPFRESVLEPISRGTIDLCSFMVNPMVLVRTHTQVIANTPRSEMGRPLLNYSLANAEN
jgi:DNA polymerase III epsilon subunit-like protein